MRDNFDLPDQAAERAKKRVKKASESLPDYDTHAKRKAQLVKRVGEIEFGDDVTVTYNEDNEVGEIRIKFNFYNE